MKGDRNMELIKAKIQKATIDDVEAMTLLLMELFSIEKDFEFAPDKHRMALKMLLKNKDAIILVAKSAGEIIGMCTVQSQVSTAEGGKAGILEDLVVTAKYRKCGIGSQLLSEMEKRAFKSGYRRLSLLADYENEPALEFYRKKNWQKCRMICLRKFPEKKKNAGKS